MTDEPEKVQQNLDSKEKINQSEASKAARFKPGFDKRRWVKGRGPKSPEQREGEEILRTVIWEELSRTFDTATMKPKEDAPEEIDALRLSVRQAIKKDFKSIMERVAGKVTDRVDVTSGNEPIGKDDSDTRAEILRKLDSIAAATGAGAVSKPTDEG